MQNWFNFSGHNYQSQLDQNFEKSERSITTFSFSVTRSQEILKKNQYRSTWSIHKNRPQKHEIIKVDTSNQNNSESSISKTNAIFLTQNKNRNSILTDTNSFISRTSISSTELPNSTFQLNQLPLDSIPATTALAITTPRYTIHFPSSSVDLALKDLSDNKLDITCIITRLPPSYRLPDPDDLDPTVLYSTNIPFSTSEEKC